jgi:hypothetical protein
MQTTQNAYPGSLSPFAEDELAQPVVGGGAQQDEVNGQRQAQSKQDVENDIGAEIKGAIWTFGLHNASLSSLDDVLQKGLFVIDLVLQRRGAS